MVTDDVDAETLGIAREEAADAPRLIGQGVDNRVAARLHRRIERVDIIGLDAEDRDDRGGGIGGEDLDLGGRVRRRGEPDDSALIHRHVEAERVGVERLALLGLRGLDVR